MTTTDPATPAEARKRVEDAKRHLFARIIASAHLLDTPFTNAPDQSPWTRMKQAMGGLTAALVELDAARATDPAPATPPEHQRVDSELYAVLVPASTSPFVDFCVDAAEATSRAAGLAAEEHPGFRAYRLVPLSTTPPAGTAPASATAVDPPAGTVGT